MLDDEGYPTEADLKKIRTWPSSDFRGLMVFVKDRWKYAESGYFFTKADGIFHFSTAGWSGNEELIASMQENRIFWSMCWQCSKRGGHYEFEIKK